jgi:uncharacterized protein with NRDE domain
VANGTTLTISPGTTIDAGDDHWLRIEGSLFATDTTFLSSATPLTQGSHGAGLWVGLQIESNGHAQLTNVVMNNSKTAVRNHGSLNRLDAHDQRRLHWHQQRRYRHPLGRCCKRHRL